MVLVAVLAPIAFDDGDGEYVYDVGIANASSVQKKKLNERSN